MSEENEENEVNQKPEKIVVVSGDGKDLDISKVHDHLKIEKPTSDNPEKDKIVIPPAKQ